MEEDIIALLLANSGVTSKVGNKVYPGRAPQGTKPVYVTIRTVTGLQNYTMLAASGYVQSRVQADVYGGTYSAMKLAARAVLAALSGFKGTQGSLVIQGIFVDAERDLPAVDEDDDVNNLFRTSIDFMIHHNPV